MTIHHASIKTLNWRRVKAKTIAQQGTVRNFAKCVGGQPNAIRYAVEGPVSQGCRPNERSPSRTEAQKFFLRQSVFLPAVCHIVTVPANAPDQDVQNALERAKINLMRSRAFGIPVDQLPK